jgi:hypothetical protein
VLGLFVVICESHSVSNLSPSRLDLIPIEVMHILLIIFPTLSTGMGVKKSFMTSASFSFSVSSSAFSSRISL